MITTNLEHNAVLRPLHHMELYNGVEVDYIPFDGKGFVDPADFVEKFKPNTKLVVVNHASNVIGTIQPVKEIGRVCKERGAIFLVDASQTAGKLPIDIQDMNIDVIAFTGHKSLLGPTRHRRDVCVRGRGDKTYPQRGHRGEIGRPPSPGGISLPLGVRHPEYRGHRRALCRR